MVESLLQSIEAWALNNPEEAPRARHMIEQLQRIMTEFEEPMRQELVSVVAETFERHRQLAMLQRWSIEAAEHLSRDMEELSTLMRECRIRAKTMLTALHRTQRRSVTRNVPRDEIN